MEQLDAGKVMLLGLIASVVAQIIKLIFAKIGKPISKAIVTVILLIISLVLAWFWFKPILPALPVCAVADAMACTILIMTFLGDILAALSTLVGFAMIVYNILMQTVFEKLGIGETEIARLAKEATKAKG